MKKNVFVLALFAVVSMCFTSCSKDELEEGNVATVEHEVALTRAVTAPEGWTYVKGVACWIFNQPGRVDENGDFVVWLSTTDELCTNPTDDQKDFPIPFHVPGNKNNRYCEVRLRGDLFEKDGQYRYEWEQVIWIETNPQAHSGGLLR